MYFSEASRILVQLTFNLNYDETDRAVIVQRVTDGVSCLPLYTCHPPPCLCPAGDGRCKLFTPLYLSPAPLSLSSG